MKKVYLIRHALPDFPGGKSMCIGMTDIPLGEQGFSQSAKMAAHLPPVTAVFSSPLSRAVQTAQAIGMPITILGGLREMYAGEWDGLTFEEIRKEGGVCRDQAYYAANTAKVMGIPAVYAVGDGDRGPHAWVVSNDSETQWNQINSYGYKTGTYSNPCSGRWHHESMLLLQTKKEKPGQYDGAADCIALSRFLTVHGAKV